MLLNILGFLFGVFLLIGVPLLVFAAARKTWRQVPTTRHVTKAIQDAKHPAPGAEFRARHVPASREYRERH